MSPADPPKDNAHSDPARDPELDGGHGLPQGTEDGGLVSHPGDDDSGDESQSHDTIGAGHRLGPYRVVRRVGAGAMGQVYEAEDTRLGRRVALKILAPEWLHSPSVRKRFLREARAASALDHPNICTLHDLGEGPSGELFLVMPFYPGETLAEKIAGGPLGVDEARTLAIQVARGLDQAHAAGIVHRDVKPANVIVTDRGEAKILDFGIAKVSDDANLTRTGTSPGTPAYMAPEQIGEGAVDARADLWALGVMLYEMLAGHRPFRSDGGKGVVLSILGRDPEPLGQIRPEVPEALAAVVSKLLVKNPDHRYASAAEVLADLESGTAPQAGPPAGHRWPRVAPAAALAAAAVLAVAGALAVALWRPADSTLEPPAEAEAPGIGTPEDAPPDDGRTSVAVLRFQNLTGDPSLDWLRHGLAEMLATDLAQSPDLEILGSGRLYQVLAELDALDDGTPRPGLAQRVAEQTGAAAVVSGNLARVGEVFRLSFQLEDPEGGAVLAAGRVEGRGEESLFGLIDDLGASLQQHFADDPGSTADPPAAPLPPAPPVTAVTTSSLEAWRLYVEGIALHRRSKILEAAALLERAVEIDPGFALALVDLSKMYGSLKRETEAREVSRRAVEHADRLPLHLRDSIEAAFYATSWETYDQAIEAYGRALARYPGQRAWASHRAVLLAVHERFEDAAAELEDLVENRVDFAGDYVNLANVYAAQGDPVRGHRLLRRLTRAQPENWFGQMALGWNLLLSGDLDQAALSLEEAERLRPGEAILSFVRWRRQTLLGNWDAATSEARQLLASPDPSDRWRGAVSEANIHLFRGRSTEAIEDFLAAAAEWPGPEGKAAMAHVWAANVALGRGDLPLALEQADLARTRGRGEWPEVRGIAISALAQLRRGDRAAAEDLLAELERREALRPNRVEERHWRHLAGRLALERGDPSAALEHLKAAETLLPPRGIEIHWHSLPDHIPIYVHLGRAHLSAGDTKAALRWFRAARAMGSERLERPLPWVKSHYWIGEVERRRGRDSEAEAPLQQFVDLWGEGDLAPEDVADAKAWLAARP
ncbi:MAG: protein kinase [Acidobacteriota bacterium]